jgi:uncharacterized protein YhhL (DUF1145 family)
MITLGGLVSLVIFFLIVGLVVWLLLWLIDYVPVPQPFNRVARIVVVVFAVLLVIVKLLQIGGVSVITP